MLDAMITQDKKHPQKVELNVWTDDETMLAFAEYDKNLHNFKVYIRDEHTNDKFIPLSERIPNLRGENNLMKICHIGLLSKIDN